MTIAKLTALVATMMVLACGCTPDGSVVSVTVNATPSISGVQHVSVTATAMAQTSRHSFDVSSAMTPLTFGIAVPASFVGTTMSVEVDLLDGPGNKLATGMGMVKVGSGITALTITIGTQPSLCSTTSMTHPLCDGFEGLSGGGGFADFWTLPPVTGGGMATIDGSMAKRGTHSLHVLNNAIGDGAAENYATLGEERFVPNDLFVRAFVYVPSTFDTKPGAITLLEQSAAPYSQIALNLDSNGFSVYDSIDGSLQTTSGVTLRTDDWVCLEWEVSVGTATTVNLWVDDQAAGGLTMPVNTVPPSGGPANEVAVGLISNLAGTRARELWIDEVMIDQQRIMCAQ
jgi:hypothetical protein